MGPVTAVPESLLKKHIKESIFESVAGIKASKRTEMPELEVEERIQSFDEADLVISENEAIYESNRGGVYCIEHGGTYLISMIEASLADDARHLPDKVVTPLDYWELMTAPDRVEFRRIMRDLDMADADIICEGCRWRRSEERRAQSNG